MKSGRTAYALQYQNETYVANSNRQCGEILLGTYCIFGSKFEVPDQATFTRLNASLIRSQRPIIPQKPRAKTAREVWCTHIGSAYNLRPQAGKVGRSFRGLAKTDRSARMRTTVSSPQMLDSPTFPGVRRPVWTRYPFRCGPRLKWSTL